MMTTRMLTSDSGTVSALAWQAMQDAAQRQLIFELGGLNAARSVLFYAAFGDSVSPLCCHEGINICPRGKRAFHACEYR